MPKPLQLRIPTPCREDWAHMQPAEKGRHCAACQKTVVDFTGMTDTEMIRYLSHSGPNICGRLAPDQINRKLIALSPPQRNGWSGWQWVLAAILLVADESGTHRPAKADTHEQSIPQKAGDSSILKPEQIDTVLKERVITGSDTCQNIMGDIVITRVECDGSKDDSLLPPAELPKKDSALDRGDDLVFQGGILNTYTSPMDSVKQLLTDTATALRDTLTKLLPKKGILIYPNPAPRGTSFHLSWQAGAEPGTYQVSLFNTSGVLIQQRIIEVVNPTQIDSWELPEGIAAGMYIIRAMRQGQTVGYIDKLVVE